MGRLEWQTEEEGPIAPEPVVSDGPRGRGWVVGLLVVALIGLAVVIIWQLGRQAEIRDLAVEEDVRAAFGVWRQAAIRQDVDLLDTLLMAGEAEWTATQRKLLSAGLLLERQALALLIDEAGKAPAESQAEIEVDADWRMAEITFPVGYLATGADRAGGEITLEHTVSLTRDGSRWLLQRPNEVFWGEWRTVSGPLASVTYRARDEALAGRLHDDLEGDLETICSDSASAGRCAPGPSVTVRLESDPEVLLRLTDQRRPTFAGRSFIMPTPTIVGLPLDENSYQVLYGWYSAPILDTYEAWLATPIQLPEQVVALLCFGQSGNAPRLFTYDPAADNWQSQFDDRTFRFLAADGADNSLILREKLPGEPNRLRLIQWSGSQAVLRHDVTYGLMTDHQVGWVGPSDRPDLLLFSYQGTMRSPTFSLVNTAPYDVGDCPASGCVLRPLDGFPVWSPDGEQSLVVSDGQVYRADGEGRTIVLLAAGHSPFWLDDRRYGFARLVSGDDQQSVELLTGLAGEDDLTALWRADEIDLSAIGASSNSPLFIQHVVALDGDPQQLLMYGRQYAGADSRYLFISLPLTRAGARHDEAPVAGPARIELALDSRPAALPSADDPNGHVPFVISPDGQWLTAGHLDDKAADRWVIQVSKIGRDVVQHFSTHYPGYAFDFPFFDWSSDGRWLLLVDENYIRLVAPESGYQRIITHDLSSCSYPAWMNQVSTG